jgi:hypothetical protein
MDIFNHDVWIFNHHHRNQNIIINVVIYFLLHKMLSNFNLNFLLFLLLDLFV